MKKLLLLLAILPLMSCTGVLNTKDIEKMDVRNEGVNMEVRYKGIFNHKIIVFDVEHISGTNSMSDVFRAFLQSANQLKDESYEKVEFACKGTSKMYIGGSYFKTLGREYSTQNVVYTIRSFSENVKTMDGESAFEKWTGGWLGVMTQQMEDFNEFHKKWYVSELANNN